MVTQVETQRRVGSATITFNFKNIAAANSFKVEQVMRLVNCRYLYSIIVFFIARFASLGGPEEKPSTSEPLPVRLKEPTGKLR